MTSVNREDYLISILRLSSEGKVVKTTELAEFMDVSPASVTEMVKSLSHDGLVIYQRYRGISLSEDGMKIACQVRKRHHIIEHFLMDYLDMEHMDAHDEAHKMEHAISDMTCNRLCNFIKHPIDDDCVYCSNPCQKYIVFIESRK